MKQILDRLQVFFSPDRIVAYLAGELVPNLVVAIVILIAFYLLWRVLHQTLVILLKRMLLDETASRFVQTVAKYIIFAIGLVSALGQLGVNTASLLTSLGVAGLTIGFAAKDALSNIISGIFIFWDRPFVIGDMVEISNEYGRVDEITMRSTRVITVDGKMLAIPNSQVVNSIVASYTNFPTLRLDIGVTVGVNENIDNVREIMLGTILNDERALKVPPAQVVLTGLNDYNLALEIRFWIKDERQHIPIRFEIRERLFNALRDSGVEMPFETIAVMAQGIPPTVSAQPVGPNSPKHEKF